MSKSIISCAIALALVLIPLSAATAQTATPAVQAPQTDALPAASVASQTQPDQDLIVGQTALPMVTLGCLDTGISCTSTAFCRRAVSSESLCLAVNGNTQTTCAVCRIL